MPDDVARPVERAVQLRAQHGPQVPDADLHGVGDGALRLPGDVDGRPRQRQRGGRVDPAGGEEGPRVRDAGSADGVGVAQQDGVPDGRERRGAGDEEAALVETLRQARYGQGRREREGVRRDGEELCVGCRVAEGANDGWLFLEVSTDTRDNVAAGSVKVVVPGTGNRCTAEGSWCGS